MLNKLDPWNFDSSLDREFLMTMAKENFQHVQKIIHSETFVKTETSTRNSYQQIIDSETFDIIETSTGNS